MGWSLSWAAVKGQSLRRVCTALGLRQTGQREKVFESDINGVEIPTGWSVLLFIRKELTDKTLQKLYEIGELVQCFVEDHVMFSSASGWKNGKRA